MLEQSSCNTEASVGDIEDISAAHSRVTGRQPVVNVSTKRKNPAVSDEDFSQSWRTALGPPPPMGNSRVRLSLQTVLAFTVLLVYQHSFVFGVLLCDWNNLQYDIAISVNGPYNNMRFVSTVSAVMYST